MTADITVNTESMPIDIRLHAVSLAAATRREVFRTGKEDGEDTLAQQVLSDARIYAAWIADGDDVDVADPCVKLERIRRLLVRSRGVGHVATLTAIQDVVWPGDDLADEDAADG